MSNCSAATAIITFHCGALDAYSSSLTAPAYVKLGQREHVGGLVLDVLEDVKIHASGAATFGRDAWAIKLWEQYTIRELAAVATHITGAEIIDGFTLHTSGLCITEAHETIWKWFKFVSGQADPGQFKCLEVDL